MSTKEAPAPSLPEATPLNYKAAYLGLFNRVSDVIGLLEQAQSEAEEQVVSMPSDE